MGTFYLPNLLTFYFLPFSLAFNLGYVITFSLAAFGTYFLARSLGVGKAGSIISGLTFSFCALFTLHIHHYNLIQTAALFPWLLWLVSEFFKSRKLVYLALLSIIVSQQIFTGFPQLTFYSLLGSFIFFFYKLYFFKIKTLFKLKISLLFLLFVLLGFLIGFVQLAQTYKLTQSSKRLTRTSAEKILYEFPFKPKNLLTVVNPYILGNPKDATYERWKPGVWGIFWENNTYFGIVPLILITTFLLVAFTKKRKLLTREIIFLLMFGLLGILLALGSSSPLYPIFSFPAFSNFRVPSRFLMYTFLASGLIAGIAIDKTLGKKAKNKKTLFLGLAITLLVIFDIYRAWSPYQMIGKKIDWLTPPQMAKYIKGRNRIVTFGQAPTWNSVFLNIGWKNQEENYLFFQNFLSRNSNITSNVYHTFAYAGMSPNRNLIMEGILDSKMKLKDGYLEITRDLDNMFKITSTNYITTPVKITSPNWILEAKVEHGDSQIFLYKPKEINPQVFMVGNYQSISTVEDFKKTVEDESFDPAKTALLEKAPNIQKINANSPGSANIIAYKNREVKITTSAEKPSILVLTDSYYPGWRAKVDGEEVEIYAANINSRAVIVPKGDHIVEFNYEPENFKTYVLISALSLALSLSIVFYFLTKKTKF